MFVYYEGLRRHLDFPEDGDLDIMRNLYIYMPTCMTLKPRTMGSSALPQREL